MVCISKSGNSWDNLACAKLVREDDETGEITIECQCSDLSVASAIEDIGGVFTKNKNFQQITDLSSSFNLLANMKFWNFAMFWVLFFFDQY